jgi:hypothetical protein
MVDVAGPRREGPQHAVLMYHIAAWTCLALHAESHSPRAPFPPVTCNSPPCSGGTRSGLASSPTWFIPCYACPYSSCRALTRTPPLALAVTSCGPTPAAAAVLAPPALDLQRGSHGSACP